MKLFLDQDVYNVTAKFLADLGHDIIRAAEIGLAQAADEELLKTAHAQDRIFVTRDRDYGNLVFVKGMRGGILYLRMLPGTIVSVHSELKSVLETYSESELKSAFVVIEANGHRFRRL